MNINYENIIKCKNKESIILFCKGHHTNNIFLEKLKKYNNKINISDTNIKQGYGEMYLSYVSKGIVLKLLKNITKKGFPITYIEVPK